MIARKMLLAALCPLLIAAPMTANVAAKEGKAAKQERKAQDHELARQAVLRREVLPLPRILALAAKYQNGDVIEVELEAKRGVLLYDVHVLVPSGEVRELMIDARSGRLISNLPKRD